MSDFKCPIHTCGRVLESANVLKEHLRRRHPSFNSDTLNAPEQDRVMQEEVNKLPKIRTLKLQVGEHKLPDIIHRRSSSKNKLDSGSLNTSKMTSVISESRSIVETAESSLKATKRPSMNKRPANSSNIERQDKLPELMKPLGKGRKLEVLDLRGKKGESEEQQSIMYTTAPNFKKLQRKQSSKEKANASLFEAGTPTKVSPSSDLLLIKTQQGFHQKQTKLHKPLRRASDKQTDKPENERITAQLRRSESKAEVREEKVKQTEGKGVEAKLKARRQASLRRVQPKPEATPVNQYNFEERIIVFGSEVGPKLSIPQDAKAEFIYANNCKLSFVTLGGAQFLRQVSLQHNAIKDLSFLSSNCSNIEKLFVDHNQLTSIDYLPPSLRVFSATFNSISHLELSSKQISKCPTLQELDLSFNPIRKEGNYKLHMLSSCLQLKKIDGMKITKFDLQLALEYGRMLDEELGLIPSSKTKDLIISRCSGSPSTMISSGEEEVEEVSQEELARQIGKLERAIKSTKDHLGVIRKENKIIKSEIEQLTHKQQESEEGGDFTALYNKLRSESAALELLNFLQWADEEQLVELIGKKRGEIEGK